MISIVLVLFSKHELMVSNKNGILIIHCTEMNK